jgi:hypothetical protein
MAGGSNCGSQRPGSRESNLSTRSVCAPDVAAISHRDMDAAVLQALDESELAEQLSAEALLTLNLSPLLHREIGGEGQVQRADLSPVDVSSQQDMDVDEMIST